MSETLPAASQQPSPLLDRVRDRIRVKRYSIRTEHAHVEWVRRHILFRGRRHPSEMGDAEIKAFLTHLAVVDKPAGMVTHPGAGRPTGTLAAAALAHAPEMAGVGSPRRPGIVHRLDKGTSGLIVLAKTPAAYEALTAQLVRRTVSRRYLCLAQGTVRRAQGVIDAPLGRDPHSRVRMAVLNEGKGRRAVTHFRVLERLGTGPRAVTFLECRLETGRTHQIRVHLASMGHPLLGDDTYRGRRAAPAGDPMLTSLIDQLGGVALHAAGLAFAHPVTGTPLVFSCPLPDRIERILSHLRTRGR